MLREEGKRPLRNRVWDSKINDPQKQRWAYFWTWVDLAKLVLYFREFPSLPRSRMAWATRHILPETFRKPLWSGRQPLFSSDKKWCPLSGKQDGRGNPGNIFCLMSNHFVPVVRRHPGRGKKHSCDVIIFPGESLTHNPFLNVDWKAVLQRLLLPRGICALQPVYKEFSSKDTHIVFPGGVSATIAEPKTPSLLKEFSLQSAVSVTANI